MQNSIPIRSSLETSSQPLDCTHWRHVASNSVIFHDTASPSECCQKKALGGFHIWALVFLILFPHGQSSRVEVSQREGSVSMNCCSDCTNWNQPSREDLILLTFLFAEVKYLTRSNLKEKGLYWHTVWEYSHCSREGKTHTGRRGFVCGCRSVRLLVHIWVDKKTESGDWGLGWLSHF